MNHPKIIIVDNNHEYRNTLKSLLINEYDAEIIAEASNSKEFNSINNLHLADIILMDIMMPEIDGIMLTKSILWKYPGLKIIAITMLVDKIYLDTLIGAGFKGYIFKNNLFKELNIALKTVIGGKLYFPKSILKISQK